MNYKTILGGAAAVLGGALLYKYGVQDLGGAGQGPLDQLVAPIGNSLNILLHGGDRAIYAIPGVVEAAGLVGMISGFKTKREE